MNVKLAVASLNEKRKKAIRRKAAQVGKDVKQGKTRSWYDASLRNSEAAYPEDF